MNHKKADVGWSFVVKLIIGLLVLIALILIAKNAKNGFSTIFSNLWSIFG